MTASHKMQIYQMNFGSLHILEEVFLEISIPNLLWNFFNIETIGVTRFLNFFVILLNKILLFYF